MLKHRAKGNPVGIPAATDSYPAVKLVKIGKKGVFTHIFDPNLVVEGTATASGSPVVGSPLCGSGYRSKNGTTKAAGARHVPELYVSDGAKYATCTRCIKLATLNLGRYGTLLQARK